MARKTSPRGRMACNRQGMRVSMLAALLVTAGGLAGRSATAEETVKVSLTAPSYWQPKGEFTTGLHLPGRGSSQSESALKFIQQKLAQGTARGAETPTVETIREFRDAHNGLYHIYMAQTKEGLQVENGGLKVTVDKNNNILTYASTVADADTPVSGDGTGSGNIVPEISAVDAVKSFARSAGIDTSQLLLEGVKGSKEVRGVPIDWTIKGASFALGREVQAELKFYQATDNALELVWSLEVEMPKNWLNVFVSANKEGRIIAVSDWNSESNVPRSSLSGQLQMDTFELELPSGDRHYRSLLRTEQLKLLVEASDDDLETTYNRGNSYLGRRLAPGVSDVSYNVIPLGFADPSDGPFNILTDPQDLRYSPQGWHNNGSGPAGLTTGNNVYAVDWLKNEAVRAEGYNFNFTFNESAAPQANREVAVTNMFYMTNAVHDIYYAYGFTEEAGNFQNANSGGGKANDPVLAVCQDESALNNAVFGTPVDGRSPRMTMFLWDSTKPMRDGALSNDIIVHEVTHGLSNRLTGGADTPNCLSNLQSRGMGEGWSDFYATALRTKETDTRQSSFAVGVYVTENPLGIRRFPYTTDMQVNPHTYSYLKEYNKVHKIGEVWCAMLLEVYWNLIDKLGFTPQYKDDAKSGKGNTLMMQLVMDGMKLQPCNPTLVQARDAILQADEANNNGANHCDIWKGFAKRGLGVSAKPDGFENAFDVPPACNEASEP